MKNIFIYVALGVLFGSCTTTKVLAQKIEGTYVQDDMSNIKLRFSEDLFFFEDDFDYTHQPPYNCSDTLAFGYWERDDKYPFIKLYTNPLQHASLINLDVKEAKRGDADSIYFIISNPMEEEHIRYNKGNENARKVYYTIYIETGDSRFDSKVNFTKYYTNNILVGVPKTGGIKKFEVTINPVDCVLGWRENMSPKFVTTMQYEVKDPKSNFFKIEIPELTACYLSSLRLNGDFIKILSNKQLEWDGHIYTKE